MESLEHEPDLLIAHPGQLLAREMRDISPIEQVHAARRMVQASKKIHEGRLSGARRSGQRDEVAGHHVEGHAAQGAHLHVPHLVGSSQIANAESAVSPTSLHMRGSRGPPPVERLPR